MGLPQTKEKYFALYLLFRALHTNDSYKQIENNENDTPSITKTEKYRLTSRKCQNYNRYVADMNNLMKSFEEIYNDQLRDLEITVNCGFIVSKHLLKQ